MRKGMKHRIFSARALSGAAAAVLLSIGLACGAAAEESSAEAAATETEASTYTVSVKKKGKSYYLVGSDGKTVKSGSSKYKVVEYDGTYYAVNNSGKLKVNCWFYIGSKVYRAKKNGTLYTNGTYDGITFSNSPAAVVNTASKLKIQTIKIVNKITTSKMSKKQKLRACWNYITKRSRWRYRSYSRGIRKDASGKSGWWYEAAYYMFTRHAGSCFNWAAAFAALAREIGYDPYIYTGLRYKIKNGKIVNTRHAWVKIAGLYYDPELEWSHGNGSYGVKKYTQLQSRFKYRKTWKFRFAGTKSSS